MKQIRCALYPRVSTEEQFVNGLSLDAQQTDLVDYANRMEYTIVGIYPDEGVSARKPVSQRPALLRLLEDVKQNKIDIILVTKLDRWFRNIREYQATEELLRAHNCHWKTIHEDYDTSTANGQMVINIMLAVAQNECDRTSERIKTVFRHKILNGEHVTGAAPYGYKTVDKKLVKDPKTEPIVDEIFSYYFSCFSKRKTVGHILEKYKDHPICPTVYQVNRILGKEQYAGIYNGRKGYYPAYITEEQYTVICTHTDSKTYAHTKEAYIFSGLIKCPVCGARMSGFQKRQKLKDGSISCYKRYRCSRKYSIHPNGACLTESVVEQHMIEHLCPELEKEIYRLNQKTVQRKTSSQGQGEKIRMEMNRLNLLFQKGRISETYYDEQYDLLEKKLNETETLIELEPVIRKYENLRKEIAGNWQELYEQLNAKHKNAFWKRIIKEIAIDKDTHKICGFSFILEV